MMSSRLQLVGLFERASCKPVCHDLAKRTALVSF